MKYCTLTLLLSMLLVTPLAHGGSGISSEEDIEPSLAEEYELAKQDRAQSYQRKMHYKTRDRQKNNPYSRDRHDEDDSVKHQSRIAKILWAASSHNTAQVHDHKREGHGNRAYSQYLQNLPQASITHPQLRTNNATIITSMPPISSETPTSTGIGIIVPHQDDRSAILILAAHQLRQELQNIGKLRILASLSMMQQEQTHQRQQMMITRVQIQANDCSIL